MRWSLGAVARQLQCCIVTSVGCTARTKTYFVARVGLLCVQRCRLLSHADHSNSASCMAVFCNETTIYAAFMHRACCCCTYIKRQPLACLLIPPSECLGLWCVRVCVAGPMIAMVNCHGCVKWVITAVFSARPVLLAAAFWASLGCEHVVADGWLADLQQRRKQLCVFVPWLANAGFVAMGPVCCCVGAHQFVPRVM